MLRAHGFELASTRGSHQKWRHPDGHHQVIVPEHRGKILPIGTLRSVINGSGIPDEKWR